jgi:Domain of unknown function DUF11
VIASRMASLGRGATILASALFVLGQAVTAAAAPAAPSLSITVSDGHSTVRPHSRAEYTLTVVNEGTRRASGVLTFAAPSNIGYQRVSSGGRITSDAIRWKITVGAGASRTERVTVRLRAIPQSAVRVTMLASFYLGAVTSTPLIRTADADRIAGRADPAPAPPLRPLTPVQHPAASSGSDHDTVDWAVITAAALLFCGLGLLLRRQVRRSHAAGVTETEPDGNSGAANSPAKPEGLTTVGFGGDTDP